MATLLHAVAIALFAVCCQSTTGPCDSPAAVGGRSYRWPDQNPALVAPVMVQYYYQPYRHPMSAELTPHGIKVAAPLDYNAGFMLTDPSGKEAPEKYQLRSMELRKPGRVPEGSSQVLPHVLELALVHAEVTGTGYWATVVLPFDVSSDPDHDVLTPLIYASKLPRKVGEISPVLRSGTQSLDLNRAFADSSFHAYWSVGATDCDGTTVPMRQLLRNTSLATVQSTFADLLVALEKAPEAPPLASPVETWITTSCPKGSTCPAYQGANVQNEYVQALIDQSSSVSQLRDRKDLMDQALKSLANSSVGSFLEAVGARDNLRDAQTQLQEIMKTVSHLEGWQSQVQSAVWNSQIPTGENSSTAAAAAGDALPAGNETAASFLGEAAHAAAKSKPAHCRALGQSPANIHTDDAQAASDALRFRYAEAPDDELRVGNYGDHLRVAARPNATGKPLGEVLLKGVAHRVSYIDLHVPGEHALNGRVPAAELQLVSLPAAAELPAVAVSFPIDEAAGAGNAWLQPLLDSRPEVHAVRHVHGASLAQLHAALRRGSAEKYYRYDGTLTRIPCRAAEWYVVEEPGGANGSQLLALLDMLPAATAPSASTKPFETSLAKPAPAEKPKLGRFLDLARKAATAKRSTGVLQSAQ